MSSIPKGSFFNTLAESPLHNPTGIQRVSVIGQAVEWCDNIFLEQSKQTSAKEESQKAIIRPVHNESNDFLSSHGKDN